MKIWFEYGYIGKQPVAWKEYCVVYWLKELQESMDRCTGCSDMTEILLKTAFNTMQSINSPFPSFLPLESSQLFLSYMCSKLSSKKTVTFDQSKICHFRKRLTIKQ